MKIRRALLMGGLAFGDRMKLGWYLAPVSFPVRKSGSSPMCYNHWQDGNDYTFANPASWFVTTTGISVMHTLNLALPEEQAVYDMARAGNLYLSYGRGASPDEARKNRVSGRLLAKSNLPWRILLGHWSYTDNPPFLRQSPVKIILEL